VHLATETAAQTLSGSRSHTHHGRCETNEGKNNNNKHGNAMIGALNSANASPRSRRMIISFCFFLAVLFFVASLPSSTENANGGAARSKDTDHHRGPGSRITSVAIPWNLVMAAQARSGTVAVNDAYEFRCR
jgi:hypothetical protein